MPQIEWELMVDPKQVELRKGLSKEQLEAAADAEIVLMRSSVANIRRMLLIYGLYVTDLYHDMKRGTTFSSEETQLAPRVRMDERRGTPSFYWERTVRRAYPLDTASTDSTRGSKRSYQGYVRRRGAKVKERMQVYLLSEHVPLLKKNQSVSMKVFEKEPEWVRVAAALIEPQLTELRRLATAIGAVNRSLSRFEQMMKKKTKEEQT